MGLTIRLHSALAIGLMTLTMSTLGFIPYRCSFQPPPGCICEYPHRPKVTCLPEEPLTSTSIPDFTLSMSAIHTLDLSGNNISAIRYPICTNCKSLTSLIVSNNGIRKIPGRALSRAPWRNTLQYLDLSYNRLDYISEVALGNIKNLRVLKLNDNKLATFRLAYSRNLKLQELYLDNNPLKFVILQSEALSTLTISYGYLYLPNLQSLQIKDTNSSIIRHFKWYSPPGPANLISVQFENVSLSDEDLYGIKLNSIHNLQILSLKDNNINLHSDHIRNFTAINPNIQFLDLSFNKITNISADTFRDLQNLETLLLNDNLITDIDWNFLKNLKYLKRLDLSRNQISNTRNLLEVKKLRHLHTLKLGYNKFDCDCDSDLMRLISLQKRGEIHVLDPLELRHSLKCASPAHNEGDLIANFQAGC